MNLVVLPDEEFHEKKKPFDLYIPEEEATDAFWSALEYAQAALRRNLLRFGPEDTAWELPDHYQRCRVLYAYLYADSLYVPDLLPAIAAAIPRDGKPWCAELECYTDARILPNGNALCLGWAVIIGDTLYASVEYKDLIACAPRRGIHVA